MSADTATPKSPDPEAFARYEQERDMLLERFGATPKFAIGARIRVAHVGDSFVKHGWYGTVLNYDTTLFVRFDKRVGNEEGDDNIHGFPGWKPGHMEIVNQDQVELSDDAPDDPWA